MQCHTADIWRLLTDGCIPRPVKHYCTPCSDLSNKQSSAAASGEAGKRRNSSIFRISKMPEKSGRQRAKYPNGFI
jgi:hypothetical protein